MELTTEQTLQKGIAAHKEGKLHEAERLYKAILEVQPAHPDANHNLGLIAVSVDKVQLALPLFEVALGVNHKVVQFWLSYIDALIKEKKLETATAVLEQGKREGVLEGKVDALEAQLKQITQAALSKLPEKQKNLTFKETRNKSAESKLQKKQTKSKISNGVSPSQQQINGLFEHYKSGQYDEAEKLALSITQRFPKHQFSWKILGSIFSQTGRNTEALNANKKAVTLSPQDADALYNLGVTLQELGRTEEGAEVFRKAIVLKPDFANAHYNLGFLLKELGKLEESEASYKQAILLMPDYAEAHSNLGNTLQDLDRLDEAEASYRQSIMLKPESAEVHNNLGNTLQKLGRLTEAEASYTLSIALKPDYPNAHFHLGDTLQKLGRLEKAEASYRQAIVLKPDLAEAHTSLSINFAIKEDYDSAVDSIRRANDIEPVNVKFIVLKKVLESRRSHKQHGTAFSGVDGSLFDMNLTSNPLILQRPVEPELVANLYDINTRKLDDTPDTRFGNGNTTDYSLFENDQFLMDTVLDDLMGIMKEAVKSNVVVYESFFNIFRAGSGITIHNHLSNLDKTQGLNLYKQKYVLQYYLRVGDQNCSEPGVYKLYEPEEELLPSEGTIIIIPATRKHSALYGGDEDRVMMGINFYAF